ncbi:MAG: hypothetical protein WDZ93_03405 [Candidatus Paceibacterota bacterium]
MDRNDERQQAEFLQNLEDFNLEITQLRARLSEIPNDERTLQKETETAINDLKKVAENKKNLLRKEETELKSDLREKERKLDKIKQELRDLERKLGKS